MRTCLRANTYRLPLSPGNLLDNTVGSSPNRHVHPGKVLTFLGPAAADDVDRIGRVLADVAGGDADEDTAFNALKLAPMQNLIWLRLLHSATGAPVVPEAIVEDRFTRSSATRSRTGPAPAP